MTVYDVIVLGTGGVGSACTFHLARRGLRVLGLDRFPGGHDRGSSHGHTRIIRMAYFEHADYVPLLRRSYELWTELEQRREKQLYFQVGLLEVGPSDGIVVPGVLRAAAQHGLPIERVSPQVVHSRFPGFRLPDGFEVVYEANAGYLLVEACVLAHLHEAELEGAQLRVGESVKAWTAGSESVRVQTDRGEYHSASLVITAGAWANDLLAELNVPLRPRRKHLHWYKTADGSYRADRGCPCFFYEMNNGYFYGFPELDDRGVKVAEHSGGVNIDDPLTDDRSVEPSDRQRVETFLSSAMPQVSPTPTDHAVCYYTMSPDEHFVVDRHPLYPQVCFAAGLSGHGFKFTSVLGEVLADLASRGETDHPIDFLRTARFHC